MTLLAHKILIIVIKAHDIFQFTPRTLEDRD